MKKTILILAVLLLTTVSIEAQNRKRAPRSRMTQTERLDQRAQRLTDVMSSTYSLEEKQQKSLLELNKKWFSENTMQAPSKERPRGRRSAPRSNRRGVDSLYLATPTLHREMRIRQLNTEVEDYKRELKKIMTSSQFKAYQKRIEEGSAQLSK